MGNLRLELVVPFHAGLCSVRNKRRVAQLAFVGGLILDELHGDFQTGTIIGGLGRRGDVLRRAGQSEQREGRKSDVPACHQKGSLFPPPQSSTACTSALAMRLASDSSYKTNGFPPFFLLTAITKTGGSTRMLYSVWPAFELVSLRSCS